jgi:rubrerythrin
MGDRALSRDSSIRELLDRLADAEDEHESLAHKLAETILTTPARAREDETSRRLFVQRLFGSPGPQLRSPTGASRN